MNQLIAWRASANRSFVVLAAAAVLFVPSVCGATSIAISPPTTTVAPLDAFTLNVDIDDVTDLFAFQFTVNFDPAVLQATSTTEGAFLPLGGSTFFISGTIDNTTGSITFLADSLIGGGPGVTGSGTLAVLGFHVNASASSGTFPLSIVFDPLNGDALLDSSLSEIVAQTIGGSVIVNATQSEPVPEPTTILLVSSGFAICLRRRLSLVWQKGRPDGVRCSSGR